MKVVLRKANDDMFEDFIEVNTIEDIEKIISSNKCAVIIRHNFLCSVAKKKTQEQWDELFYYESKKDNLESELEILLYNGYIE